MYKRGDIADLTPISIPEVEKFVISPMDEIDYFNCSKEDLVSLKEYLLELKEKKKEYQKLISEPLKYIKKKNPWCVDVDPANGIGTDMVVNAKNYPPVYLNYNGDSFMTNPYGGYFHPILDFVCTKKYEKRSQVATNSEEELNEILEIMKSFGFTDEDEGVITASNRFLIVPYSFEEVRIQKRAKTSFYHTIKVNKNNEFVSDYCGLTHFSGKESTEYADAFVKKLYLPNIK